MAILPTVRVFKDGEKRIINETDLDAWLADGWATEAPPASADAEAEEPVVKEEPKPRKRRGTSQSGDDPLPGMADAAGD